MKLTYSAIVTNRPESTQPNEARVQFILKKKGLHI